MPQMSNLKEIKMIDESQTAQSQAQQPQIKIGFEASLELLNPEWRTAYSPEQVNQFRFFYQSAMRDLSMFIGATKQTQDNLVQAFQFMDANAVATHNMPAATEVPASDVGIADSGSLKRSLRQVLNQRIRLLLKPNQL